MHLMEGLNGRFEGRDRERAKKLLSLSLELSRLCMQAKYVLLLG